MSTHRPEVGSEILTVNNLNKVYGSGPDANEAIHDISFSLKAGEMVCIVGPSGAGKTTLLRSIAGLLPPTSGSLQMEGERISGPPKGMAVVFQEYARSLFPWLTVYKNVELPLKERGMPKTERKEKVEAALSAVGLGDVPHSYPWQLSGGMQQRVAIARAVAYEPHVLLMDEPFAAVDAQTRADLEDLVRELWSRLGMSLLFVTHDIDESIYLGQRVLVLSHRPTIILEDVVVDLPDERSQLVTRNDPRFAELRTHVHTLVQKAKGGYRGEGKDYIYAEGRTAADQAADDAAAHGHGATGG